MSKWNKIIVITPKTNRKFQCEFAISVYETPADESNPHPRNTLAGPRREFKSPVKAVKFLEALLSENEDIGVSKNSGPSYNELYFWARTWEEEKKLEQARHNAEVRLHAQWDELHIQKVERDVYRTEGGYYQVRVTLNHGTYSEPGVTLALYRLDLKDGQWVRPH